LRTWELSTWATGAAAFDGDADPAVTEKFDRISGAAANVGGIWHWLDKLDQPAG
jgi:hypothetical protein